MARRYKAKVYDVIETVAPLRRRASDLPTIDGSERERLRVGVDFVFNQCSWVPVEFTLSFTLFCWGLVVLGPWDTFGTGSGWRVLRELTPYWASEGMWGTAFSVIGGLHAYRVLTCRRWLRYETMVAVTVSWLFLFGAIAATLLPSTGIPLYLLPFLYGCWKLRRLQRLLREGV